MITNQAYRVRLRRGVDTISDALPDTISDASPHLGRVAVNPKTAPRPHTRTRDQRATITGVSANLRSDRQLVHCDAGFIDNDGQDETA